MESLTLVLIGLVAFLVIIVIGLLLQPRKMEVPQIQEMEEKLKVALASETFVQLVISLLSIACIFHYFHSTATEQAMTIINKSSIQITIIRHT